jgi:hypothetical protein
MKNNELWDDYKEYTKTLSEVARKLGFAAAAICWFFKTPDNIFPPCILVGLGFIVLYFMCDILQLLFGAVLIRTWTRKEEKKMWKEKNTIYGEYDKPERLDKPSYIMWWIKIICLLIAFSFMGLHLIHISITCYKTEGLFV